MPLTERDREVLRALSLKVPVLSLEQVARGWWGEGRSALEGARGRAKKLVGAGLIVVELRLVHPEIDLPEPVLRWEPGDPTPPFGKLSYRLRSRWGRAHRLAPLCRATAAGARQFGGVGGPHPRPLQLSHDLHVGALYVQIRCLRPELVDSWIGEVELRRRGLRGKLPDAALVDGSGGIERILEFGGAYGPERLRADHAFCEAQGYPYELW